MPSAADRDTSLNFLKAACESTDRDSSGWRWLTVTFLGLPENYIDVVWEQVTLKGGWRNAKNPRAYLRTACRREAKKLGIAEPRKSPSSLKEIDEDTISLLGGGDDDDYAFRMAFGSMSRDQIVEKIASRAGLDKEELVVLYCKRRGISRDKAMNLQLTEEARRKMQAAWRRFDDTGMKKLREALQQFESRDSGR